MCGNKKQVVNLPRLAWLRPSGHFHLKSVNQCLLTLIAFAQQQNLKCLSGDTRFVNLVDISSHMRTWPLSFVFNVPTATENPTVWINKWVSCWPDVTFSKWKLSPFWRQLASLCESTTFGSEAPRLQVATSPGRDCRGPQERAAGNNRWWAPPDETRGGRWGHMLTSINVPQFPLRSVTLPAVLKCPGTLQDRACRDCEMVPPQHFLTKKKKKKS